MVKHFGDPRDSDAFSEQAEDTLDRAQFTAIRCQPFAIPPEAVGSLTTVVQPVLLAMLHRGPYALHDLLPLPLRHTPNDVHQQTPGRRGGVNGLTHAHEADIIALEFI